MWVYPRVYGEILSDALKTDPVSGLPPCVRGNHHKKYLSETDPGSTPVCTGKSRKVITKSTPKAVYPRVYGEISEDKI